MMKRLFTVLFLVCSIFAWSLTTYAEYTTPCTNGSRLDGDGTNFCGGSAWTLVGFTNDTVKASFTPNIASVKNTNPASTNLITTNHIAWTSGTPRTICAGLWFNATQNGKVGALLTPGGWCGIGWGNPDITADGFAGGVMNGSLKIMDIDGGGSGLYYYLPKVENNTWHPLVVETILDGGAGTAGDVDFRVWLDGVLVADRDAVGCYEAVASQLYMFGSSYISSNMAFVGHIDHAIIYNGACTDEIVSDFNQTPVVVVDNLSISWDTYAPTNLSTNYNASLNYTFEIISNKPLVNCSFIFNGTLNQTKYNLPNGSIQNFSINDTFANYNVSASVNCSVGSLTNSSGNKYVLWQTYNVPFLRIGWDHLTPYNMSENRNDSLELYYYFQVNSTESAINCSFVFNTTLNQTKYNLANNTVQNFTISGLATIANLSSSVNCSTTNGLTNSSTTKYVNWKTIKSIDSNISDYTEVIMDFMVLLNASDFSDQPVSCTVLTNNTAVSCSQNFTIDPLTNVTDIACSVGTSDLYENVKFTPYCNSSALELNGSEQDIFVNRTFRTSTNLSGYLGRINNAFVAHIHVSGFFNATPTCGVVDNSSVVSCVTNPLNSSNGTQSICLPSGSVSENVTFQARCYTSYKDNRTQNWTYFVDNVKPLVTVHSPSTDNTSTYTNQSDVLFNISVSDNNLFGVNLTCVDESGVQAYSFEEQDIVAQSYELINTTTISNTGKIKCTFIAADDHTVEVFKEVAKIDKATSTKVEGSVGLLDFAVTSSKITDMDIMDLKDRKSFRIEIDNSKGEWKQVNITYTCPYSIFKREGSDYVDHWVCVNSAMQGYWLDGETTEMNNLVSSKVVGNKIIQMYETRDGFLETNSIGRLNNETVVFNITVYGSGNVSVYANNAWNGSAINVFNVTISNSSWSANYSTLTGNVNVNLTFGTYIVTQTASGYPFGNLSTSQVVAGVHTFNTSFWQSELTVNVRETLNQNLIVHSYLNVSGNITNDVVTGSQVYKINNGSFTINASNTSGEFIPSSVIVSGSIVNGEKQTINVNLSRAFTVTFLREETGLLFNLSESNESNVSLVLTIECNNSQLNYTIDTNPYYLQYTGCDWNSVARNYDLRGWLVTVEYPEADESYFRYINPATGMTDIDVYLLDLNEDTIVNYIITLNDLANKYKYAVVTAERGINGIKHEVIAMKVDIAKSVHMWFDKDGEYKIYAYNDDGVKTEIGYIIASAATTQSIVLPSLALEDTNPIIHANSYWIYNVSKSTGNLSVVYTDTTTLGVQNLTVKLYELTMSDSLNSSVAVENGLVNITLLSQQSYLSGKNRTIYIPPTLNLTKTYMVEVTLVHYNVSYTRTERQIVWYGTRMSINLDGFDTWESDVKLIVAIGVIIGVLMIFSAISIEWGMGLALILSTVFWIFDWLDPIVNRYTYHGLSWFHFYLAFFALGTGIYLWRKYSKTT